MSYKQLSMEEREKIQEMLWEKRFIRYMAKKLNHSHTSVSTELRRNNPKQN